MKKVLLMLLLFLGSHCLAQTTYSCLGTVDKIRLGADATIILYSKDIYGDNSPRRICSLNEAWGNITVENCKAWYSMLLAAHSTKKELAIEYHDTVGSCENQPTWSSSNQPWALRLQ
ncbi:hypothetical protein [Microbulbifer thermotolerans]|uniref:hypothetical protein n=1 Tax=Microbulbifer thermotolerans TaxID=252514 RepID=UPI00224AF78F|nr:hypothetical protein [Microbulbifer thermotolerans]MCX2780655.1 hypothetical protein [Microbulbifer thermotolerans]MCX2806357.1 hypothetical protein [Microbulbifer thermotolerans]